MPILKTRITDAAPTGTPGVTLLNRRLTNVEVDENFLSLYAGLADAVTSLGDKLDKAGGTLTGFLTANADPTTDLHVATKHYVDVNAATPVNDHIADATAAHAASAISLANTDYAATDVDAALSEISDIVAAHVGALHAHNATSIDIDLTSVGGGTGDVQTVVSGLYTDKFDAAGGTLSGDVTLNGNLGINEAPTDLWAGAISFMRIKGKASGALIRSETSDGAVVTHSFTDSNGHAITVLAAKRLGFGTDSTERLTIAPNGNVGVGTVTPVDYGAGWRMFEVRGPTGGSGIVAAANDDNSCRAEMFVNGLAGILRTVTNHPLQFQVNGVAQAVIDTAGNTSLGSSSASSSFGRLYVADATAAGGLMSVFFGNSGPNAANTRVRLKLAPTAGFVGSPTLPPYIEAGVIDALNNTYLALGTYSATTGVVSEWMRIDEKGYVAFRGGGMTPLAPLHLFGNSAGGADYTGQMASDTSSVRADLVMKKSRGTHAAPTAVVNADYLGIIRWRGYNTAAADFGFCADIFSQADGAAIGSFQPANLGFSTQGGEGLAPTMRLLINAEGTVRHAKLLGQIGPVLKGSVSGAVTVDWNAGNAQHMTLGGNVTGITFTKPVQDGAYKLVLLMLQDATGGRTVAWTTAVNWSGGAAPVIASTASKYTIISLYCTVVGGTATYWGSGLAF